MKYIFQIFILLLILQSCDSKELKVAFKTIEINIPGTPGPSLKYHSKYYCFFETDSDEFSSYPSTDFYILDENGKIESKIPISDRRLVDYDLYVKNDSIFTTEYNYNNTNTFYLDQKNKIWVKTKGDSDVIYKDKNYTISSQNTRNYGNGIGFKNNTTGQQYNLDITNPIINKLNDNYYLTTKEAVLKIPIPVKIESGKANVNTDNSQNQNTASPLKGMETLYKGSTSTFSKSELATSFVVKNKLYHLYTDDNSAKIGAIKNNELMKIYEFTADILPYRRPHDTKNFIPDSQYQTIQFSTKLPHVFGIIEIDKNQFNVITFKNLYREPIQGEPKIKALVEKNFDYFYSNFNTLSIDQINRIEQQENALSITPEVGICRYLVNGSFAETPIIYRKIERKYIHLLTTYYYSSSNKALKQIGFKWKTQSGLTLQDEEDKRILYSLNTRKIFQAKFDWLSVFLKQKLGKPVSEESNSCKWENGNLIVELSCSGENALLTLYNKEYSN